MVTVKKNGLLVDVDSKHLQVLDSNIEAFDEGKHCFNKTRGGGIYRLSDKIIYS